MIYLLYGGANGEYTSMKFCYKELDNSAPTVVFNLERLEVYFKSSINFG